MYTRLTEAVRAELDQKEARKGTILNEEQPASGDEDSPEKKKSNWITLLRAEKEAQEAKEKAAAEAR